MIRLKHQYMLFKLKNNLNINNISINFFFKFEDRFDLKKKINKHLSSLSSDNHSAFFDNSNSLLNNALKLLSVSTKAILINKQHSLKSIYTNISSYVFLFLSIAK
jgi:hypothetical protein